MIFGNYVLMAFYTMVTGWMLYYTIEMFTGFLTSVPMTQEESGNFFNSMLQEPEPQIMFTAAVTIAGFAVCAFGLRKGVEGFTKPLMVLLFLLLLFQLLDHSSYQALKRVSNITCIQIFKDH